MQRFDRTAVLVRDNVVESMGYCARCGQRVSCPVGPMAYVKVMGRGEEPLCAHCLRDVSSQLGDMYESWDSAASGAMGTGQQWGPQRAFDPTS